MMWYRAEPETPTEKYLLSALKMVGGSYDGLI